MALGTNNTTAAVAGNFIPELWSDEVIGAYKSNLVIANLVTKLSHKGKKGDTIHIPVPARGSASAKAANTQVTLSAATNSVINISIDQHYEYSKLIEDIAEVQSLASMRKFYTDDAGYALSTQVDTKLGTLWEALQGGTVGGSNAASWETAYDAIRTGKIGMIYGVDVYISSNVPTTTESGGGSPGSTDRVGCLMHRDALVLAEQVGVRSQTQYKQEYLGDLFTSDTIYGVGELRDDAGVAFVVPAS